ncbi:MAG: hypothetical protein DME23_11490 [Verrucomicrobia bacterium]|nr:MAG: hypothetical protein DME23_11490 [Verrucomicrobiota bacterium]
MRCLVGVLLAAAAVAAIVGWQQVRQLRSENELLRRELQKLQERSAAAAEAQFKQHDEELQGLRAQARDVFKLRGEVTQLRQAAKEAESLRAENQQLHRQNQQLRSGASASITSTAAAASQSPQDQFPRENWTFAGYSTPETALVSAVWAMKEGKPQVYFDSLSPEEQARMAKAWENKSQDEIAVKHQQDVSRITGVRVLEREEVSPDEVRMKVYTEGAGTLETISMKRIGGDWKFGGVTRTQTK